MKKLPGIACDIDGVLILGRKPILKAIHAMQRLQTPLKTLCNFPHNSLKFPFVCLSNSGGTLEINKANQINSLMNLDKESNKLSKEQFILNFTPLRPIIQSYKNKSVLLVGKGNIGEIMEDCGVFHYLNTKEFNALSHSFNNEYTLKLTQRIKSVMITESMKKEFLDISAIFILNDPIEWEDNIMLISKLLKKNPKTPIYVSHNDTLYCDEFPLPRFGIGGYNEVLKVLALKNHNIKFNLIYSGKPLPLAFEFSKKRLQEIAKPYEISNFYMIGDNPKVDILGGKNNGFRTILVRTGVFKEGLNDLMNPADYVVEDFEEAVKLIEILENI